MTDRKEIDRLAKRAAAWGAVVVVDKAMDSDSREYIDTVRVIGLPGCGSHPMSPVAAAERLRELV